jgi:hypothetical protein
MRLGGSHRRSGRCGEAKNLAVPGIKPVARRLSIEISHILLGLYLLKYLSKWNMLGTEVVQKTEVQIICSIIFRSPYGFRGNEIRRMFMILSFLKSCTDFHQILYCRSLQTFLESLILHKLSKTEATNRDLWETKIICLPLHHFHTCLCTPPFIIEIRIWHLKIRRQRQNEVTKLLRYAYIS